MFYPTLVILWQLSLDSWKITQVSIQLSPLPAAWLGRPRALETSLRSSLETFSTWALQADGADGAGAWCLVPMVISLGKDGMEGFGMASDDALGVLGNHSLGIMLLAWCPWFVLMAGDDLVANGL